MERRLTVDADVEIESEPVKSPPPKRAAAARSRNSRAQRPANLSNTMQLPISSMPSPPQIEAKKPSPSIEMSPRRSRYSPKPSIRLSPVRSPSLGQSSKKSTR